MSSRALQRLQKTQKGNGNNDIPSPTLSSNESEQDEIVEFTGCSSFAALVSSDESVDEQTFPIDDKTTTIQSQIDAKEALTLTSSSSKVKDKNKKQQSNKDKSKKNKQSLSCSNKNSTNDKEEKDGDDSEDDVINEMLEKLALEKKKDREGKKGVTCKDEQLTDNIFTINIDHLDPALELKRKIGGPDKDDASLSVSNIPDTIAQHRLAALIRNKTKVHRYRKQLIVPRPLWPKVTSALVDLRLERINHDLYGNDTFQFMPKDLYDRHFDEFIELVEVGDIELVYAFARKHPLHVDTLLIVSDFLRFSSQPAEAAELAERAVYILEKSLLATEQSGIDITSGKLRIPYDMKENRRLHLALFRYIQFLIKRGCHQTAFEFGKMLWSLDPFTDPLAIRLTLDFLAVQSGELEWLDFVYEQIIVLESPWIANWHYTKALSLLLRKDPTADNVLQEAILAHPWIVPKLAQACGIQLDEATWCNAFSIATTPSTHNHYNALKEAISKVYAQRCNLIWRSPPRNFSFLQKNIGIALSNRLTIDKDNYYPIKDYRPSIMESLPIFRHTLLSDMPNVQVSLPITISSDSIHLYDPLPPEDALDDDQLEEDGQKFKPKCLIQ